METIIPGISWKNKTLTDKDKYLMEHQPWARY